MNVKSDSAREQEMSQPTIIAKGSCGCRVIVLKSGLVMNSPICTVGRVSMDDSAYFLHHIEVKA